jgi:hypothetical protein
MHRHFPATSWLPTAPSCTPNNPPCTPGAPWVDSDRRRWGSAFFGFPSFPPTRTPHPTTPYTLRALDHRPDSESQPQPLFFHLARKTPRFWYTLKSGPVGGRDSALARPVQGPYQVKSSSYSPHKYKIAPLYCLVRVVSSLV